MRQLNLPLKPALPARWKRLPQKSESSIVSWICWRWTQSIATSCGSLREGRALVLMRRSGVKDREMARQGYKLLKSSETPNRALSHSQGHTFYGLWSLPVQAGWTARRRA